MIDLTNLPALSTKELTDALLEQLGDALDRMEDGPAKDAVQRALSVTFQLSDRAIDAIEGHS